MRQGGHRPAKPNTGTVAAWAQPLRSAAPLEAAEDAVPGVGYWSPLTTGVVPGELVYLDGDAIMVWVPTP